MISIQNLTLQFGKRVLFEDVSLKFTNGNCYGLIGPNGAGKSTLLKVLAGEVEQTAGNVVVPKGLRISVLKQDHFEYSDYPALETVLMGHERLHRVSMEKDALYSKPEFDEADGMRVAELEADFAEMNGWGAEAQAAELLCCLGIPTPRHGTLVKDLDDGDKVRVLLAQAVFGDPDILLLDEPTNHLDVDSILWLEEFLAEFRNTVIVVSHDRHFLNKVCTHTADIDFGTIALHTGNYDFWFQASELALKHQRAKQAKDEEKAKELKAFIARFSANASKSRQATSRKKMLGKLTTDNFRPSSRKYPHVTFDPEPLRAKAVVRLENITHSIAGETLLRDFSLTVARGEKIVIVSRNSVATSTLLEIMAGAVEPDEGSVEWGQTVRKSFLPKDASELFSQETNLIDWLREYSVEKDENFVRGFLGRMLFTGDETKKPVNVLSGGEKVRCMISRMMLEDPHCMVLDGPTNHLDLETITSLNKALVRHDGTLIFSSHDQEFARSIAGRVLEITPTGAVVDHHVDYDEFLRRRAAALDASTADSDESDGSDESDDADPFENELIESVG
ncbi:MAG: ATP-binding cassette domain-containing protein [bacterium]|nr:ATP-binding cassette domain-containing protein [bacterium]